MGIHRNRKQHEIFTRNLSLIMKIKSSSTLDCKLEYSVGNIQTGTPLYNAFFKVLVFLPLFRQLLLTNSNLNQLVEIWLVDLNVLIRELCHNFLKVIYFLCNQLSYLLLLPKSGKPCLWISIARSILLLLTVLRFSRSSIK